MNPTHEKKSILELMAENEEAVARLYRAYAERFPRHRDFWHELANEEIHHSRLIQHLPAGKDSFVKISENRFDLNVFQVSLDYLEKKLTESHLMFQMDSPGFGSMKNLRLVGETCNFDRLDLFQISIIFSASAQRLLAPIIENES